MSILTMFIIFIITLFSVLIPLFIIILMISKTISFKSLSTYFKVYKGRNKGLVIGRIYSKDLTVKDIVLSKTTENHLTGLVNKGSEPSSFINPQYYKFYGLPCADYFEEDIEPRSPICSRDIVTDPQAYQNIWFNSIKSQDLSKDLFKLLKNPVVIGFLIFIALLFIALIIMNFNLNSQLIEVSHSVATNKVVVS